MLKSLKSIEDLKPAPYNPRKISDKAAKGLKRSLEKYGDVSGITWNKRTGNLVCGHQRVEQLKELGAKLKDDCLVIGKEKFRIKIVDVDLKTEKQMNVVANNQALAGEFIPEIDDLGFDILESVGELDFEELRFNRVLNIKNEVEEDEIPEPPKNPVSKLGDVWELGDHRVVCGDATNKKDHQLLVTSNALEIMVTDPPYGVNYTPSWRMDVGINKNKNKMGVVKNDDRSDWFDAWVLFGGSVAYVYHAGLKSGVVADSLIRAGFDLRSQIIWAKDRMALSRSDYHWQHEPCWYAVRNKKPSKMIDDRSQTTLWRIQTRDDSGHGHGTQKPIECMAKPIRNHKFKIVYDPFLGSGTTLIAAEQLNRKCYGIEIEPKYVDVTIERWQNLTGKKAIRK